MYSVDTQLPSFYERTRSQTVTLPVYAAGMVPTVPTAGVFTLYDQSKTVVVTGATTVVDGVHQYAVPGASLPDTLSLSGFWQEEWVMTFADGHVETFRRDAYLCLRLLHPVVTEPMLVRRVADLQTLRPPTLPDFSTYISEAWGIIQRRLLQDGKRPYMIMNDYAFADWHVALTLELVFLDLSTYTGDGRFSERAMQYREDADKAYDKIRFEYDVAETNARASAAPSISAKPVLYTNFAPSMAYRPFGPRRV